MSSYPGTWYNELGSVMVLSGSGADIWGTYNSKVGQAQNEYRLTGRVNTAPVSGTGIALGWTVACVNAYLTSPSATSWSGQYFADAGQGQEEISALWMLVTETTPGSEWKSTQVNLDTFQRQPFSKDQIAAARARRARPFPREVELAEKPEKSDY